MSIESLKNRINKRIDLRKYKRNYTDIGSFIKKKRKELNVTQDEISNGICSISYLSKIENNQIIPNDFYVREIMEKLEVDEAIYTRSLKEKEYLDKIVKSFFYMDDTEIVKIYQEIKMIEHNLNINLCKLGYTVYFNKEDNDQYVMMLEHLVNNMSDYEIKMYLYFATLYFVQHEKYKTALELVLLSDKIPNTNDMLDAMLYEVSYYIKQRLLVKNSSTEDYYNAMNVFSKYHNVNRIIILSLHKAFFLLTENPNKTEQILNTIKVNLLPDQYKDMYYYIRARVQFNLERFKDCTLSLKAIKKGSDYYLRKMTLLLKICFIEEDYNMIENIKQLVKDYLPSKKEMKSKIYYHFLTHDNEEDKKQYLRDIAIPFSIHVEDYELLQVYIDHVMQICMDNSRYKEATQYYRKYQKEINKVKRIMY